MLKNWGFWTVVLEKNLESPLDCKEIQPVHPKGDQSWIFIGRLKLKLKLQCFSHLMRRADSLEKNLMLGKTESRRRRGWQRTRCLEGITDSMDMNLNKLREIVKDREAWRAAVHGVTKSRIWLSNWTKISRIAGVLGLDYLSWLVDAPAIAAAEYSEYHPWRIVWIWGLFLVPPYITPSLLKAPDQQEGTHRALSCSHVEPIRCVHIGVDHSIFSPFLVKNRIHLKA